MENKKYTTILQAWDFRPGSNFVLEMQQAAKEANRTIAVLSPDYLNAEYTHPEWAAAFIQDPIGKKGTLLPVCVRPCEIKGMLPLIIYIDLVDLDESKARHALLEGIKRERIKPTTQPEYPGSIQRQITKQPHFPGALPSIWNVPYQRNINFTGRAQLLSDLQKTLTSGPTALTQVIHGLGGVGKTQLALEYAYRNTDKYHIIWWIRSEDSATLASDYSSLAQVLDLPEKDAADQPVIIEAVRHYLEQQQNWLLVFDNADDPALIKKYIPQSNTGHVLVTSRNPNWRGIASPLSVQILERKESIDFLLKRTGQTDTKAAGDLADALGDLPLALEQAGAYIEAAGISLSSYLDMFTIHRNKLLDRSAPSTDYPDTIATTWEISINEVRKTCQIGVDLLNLCAFLAPDDIYEELIKEGAEYLPNSLASAVIDSLIFNDAIMSLRRYSLMEVTAGTMSVHGMVQAVVRDKLTEDDRKRWAEAAVQIVNDAFPSGSNDVVTWPQCSRLLPHALAVARYGEELDVAADATGRVLNETGVYLQGRAQFVIAKKNYERALEIGEAAYGPNHPNVARYVNNLGSVLQDLGDLQGAKENLERALEIEEDVYGPNHPNIARYVNNLGGVLLGLGDLQEAKKNFERALEIDKAACGPNHTNVARDINNLGSILKDLGDFQGAKKFFERALEIGEAAYDSNHPNIARYVNNLGSVLQDQGNLEGAKKNYEVALEIDEAAYGPNHPNVAIRVNNLGRVLHDLGDLQGAKKNYKRALEINESAYGPNHPNVATVVNNLGLVLQALGDLEGAKRNYERALEIYLEYYGENHPNTVLVQTNLNSLYSD